MTPRLLFTAKFYKMSLKSYMYIKMNNIRKYIILLITYKIIALNHTLQMTWLATTRKNLRFDIATKSCLTLFKTFFFNYSRTLSKI